MFLEGKRCQTLFLESKIINETWEKVHMYTVPYTPIYPKIIKFALELEEYGTKKHVFYHDFNKCLYK